jgi:bacterioferritin-associated ferredoxin
MFVCVCMAVPQSVVEGVIADGAHSREAVTRACRAGGDCGACHGMIDDMIEAHLEGPGRSCRADCAAAPESGDRLVPPGELVRARERAA